MSIGARLAEPAVHSVNLNTPEKTYDFLQEWSPSLENSWSLEKIIHHPADSPASCDFNGFYFPTTK